MRKRKEMKRKAAIAIVATALVLSIAFSGVALAAQTSFSIAVNGGSVRTQSCQTTATYGDLPYDTESYNLDVFAVHANQFAMTHTLDSDYGVEAETGLSYMPASNIKTIFLTEELKKARVAEGENESVCYGGEAKTRATAQMLGYESASIADASNVGFAMKAVGMGKLNVQMQEKIATGNENSTWTESVTYDALNIRSGLFNASAVFTSEVPEYPPAAPPRECVLCPFFKP